MPPDWILPGPFPPEIETGERCAITELLNDPAVPEVSLAQSRVQPGVTTELHVLDGISERYVITKGQGLMEVDGRSWAVKTGDRVLIEPGLPQRITNTGEGVLVFHCVCTPRFQPQAYRSLEED